MAAWAEGDRNVRALLLSGSLARGDADRLSDVDVEVYVLEPARLLDSSDWYERFGDVLVVEALDNPGWMPTRLVYYAGGKIDFAIGAADSLVLERTTPFETLVDKDGLTRELRIAPEPTGPQAIAVELPTAVQWFWAAALMCAKAVVRDEPWLAQGRLGDARQELLRLVAWDHKARYGWEFDTAFGGKRLTKWADRDVVAALAETFAALDCADIERSLMAAVSVFHRLTTDVAHAVGHEAFDHRRVEAEVRSLLDLPRETGPPD